MKKILNRIFVFSSISPFAQDNEIKTQIEIITGMIIETIEIIRFQIKYTILFNRSIQMLKIHNKTIAMDNARCLAH